MKLHVLSLVLFADTFVVATITFYSAWS